jgi:hypothetical protein
MPGRENPQIVEEETRAVEDHRRRRGASQPLIARGFEQPPIKRARA